LRGEDEGGGEIIPLTLTLSLRGERENIGNDKIVVSIKYVVKYFENKLQAKIE